MSPKTVWAYTKFSHLMRLQSTPEIKQVIRNGFVAILANAIDEAALNGSGSSSQPTGILQTSGIGSVADCTNGLAPTFDNVIDLKKVVSIDNADSANAAYVTYSKNLPLLRWSRKLWEYQGSKLFNSGGRPITKFIKRGGRHTKNTTKDRRTYHKYF